MDIVKEMIRERGGGDRALEIGDTFVTWILTAKDEIVEAVKKHSLEL